MKTTIATSFFPRFYRDSEFGKFYYSQIRKNQVLPIDALVVLHIVISRFPFWNSYL